MAIQRYFTRTSRYWTASSAWLNQASPAAGQNNFEYLIANFQILTWNTAAFWPVNEQNRSASYTRNGGPGGRLILGPFIGNLPQIDGPKFNLENINIGRECFFYDDPNLSENQTPENTQDTPFLIRGIATALVSRLRADKSLSIKPLFWAHYDGSPNAPGSLSIQRIHENIPKNSTAPHS
jgi:hypothetical protein